MKCFELMFFLGKLHLKKKRKDSSFSYPSKIYDSSSFSCPSEWPNNNSNI